MSQSKKKLYEELNKLDTEQINLATKGIDIASSIEIATLINQEDQKVAEQVKDKLAEIAEAMDLVADSFSVGGKLFYFGSGTSGRLGVVDAAECPPTFGSEPEQVQGFIAGGKEAMFVAQEGVEDSKKLGAEDIQTNNISNIDVVCGIAASGRTPYVQGAVEEAKKRGIKTIFVTTVPEHQLSVQADIVIDVPVGPEVIMGSTRMKSGTAQKMILNMITTGAFIRRGKVYENVMVDLKLTNQKLVERAKRIIVTFGNVSYETASELLESTNGHVKTSLLMAVTKFTREEAETMLNKNNGFIRKVLQNN